MGLFDDRKMPQGGQADPDETADVVGDLPSIADVGDDLFGGALKVFQVGVAGLHARRARFAQRQVPAELLVAAGQRGREHLGEGLLGGERGEEQGAQQVGVGLQGEPGGRLQGVEARGDGVCLAGADHDHLVEGEPGGHRRVLGLGGFHDQPRDVVGRGGLQQSADGVGLAAAGGAADEGVPVQTGEGQEQGASRVALPVQHHAESEAFLRVLAGDIEDRRKDVPDAWDLLLGWAGEGGDQFGPGGEGRAVLHALDCLGCGAGT